MFATRTVRRRNWQTSMLLNNKLGIVLIFSFNLFIEFVLSRAEAFLPVEWRKTSWSERMKWSQWVLVKLNSKKDCFQKTIPIPLGKYDELLCFILQSLLFDLTNSSCSFQLNHQRETCHVQCPKDFSHDKRKRQCCQGLEHYKLIHRAVQSHHLQFHSWQFPSIYSNKLVEQFMKTHMSYSALKE